MSDWVKFSDAWIGSPRIEALGADAITFHQSALSLSSRHRTDGWIADQIMRHLYPVADAGAVIAALVEAGLWERRAGGFYLLTWADHLLARDELVKRADASRESSERYRRCKANDHSMCDRCAAVRARQRETAKGGDTSRDGSVTTSVIDPLFASSRIASSRNEVEGRSEERRGGGSDSGNGSAVPSPPPPDEGEPPPWAAGLPPGEIPTLNGVPVTP